MKHTLLMLLVVQWFLGCTRSTSLVFTEVDRLETIVMKATRTRQETIVYVSEGEPTQIVFPDEIDGGYKRKTAELALDKQKNFLVIFAGNLPPGGEALLVMLKNSTTYPIRIKNADPDNPRDTIYKIHGTTCTSTPSSDDPGLLYRTVTQTKVYESPSTSSKMLAELSENTPIYVTEVTDNWLQLRSTGGRLGFLKGTDAQPFCDKKRLYNNAGEHTRGLAGSE